MVKASTFDDRPLLYLPVENQVRELDAKLLLAACASERGYQVVLGSQTYLFLQVHRWPLGTFVAKSMRAVNARTLRLIAGLGNDIVAWDEESLVRFDSPEYFPWRYSTDIFQRVSRLFSWGRNDAAFFASFPGYSGVPIHVTGNPRADLLRSEMRGYFTDETARLRRTHGPFVLINTNFAFVNHHLPALNLVVRDRRGAAVGLSRNGRGMSLAFGVGMATHQQAIFDAFRALVPALAARFPNIRFVLRPHPSESMARWQAELASLANVMVVHEGNVVPWLMASTALLHNGCTTAVEARVLGTPTVAYLPIQHPAFDYRLPNGLGQVATSVDQVGEQLARLLSGQPPPPNIEESRLLGEHLAALEGELAADRIIRVLCEAPALRPPSRSANLARLGLRGRSEVQQLKMSWPGYRHSPTNHAKYFPPMGVEDISARIGRLRDCLGRFQRVAARPLSPHLFHIGCE